MKRFIRDTLTIIILAVVIFIGLQITVQRYAVDGPSMLTNFQNGQQLMINKIVYRLHDPERGDVVIFQMDELGKEGYIKRIIGLPGETVKIEKGVVYIHKGDGNVIALDEPYIAEPARTPYEGEVIPPNEYFVLGDNRNNSSDSRQDWTLPRDCIIGKVWLSIWPFESFGLVNSYAYASE